MKSLCLSKCIFRKSRRIRLKERAVERFESQLDIRSIVKARVDLTILVRSILSKEQLVLFQNQDERAFTKYDSSTDQKTPREQEDDFIE